MRIEAADQMPDKRLAVSEFVAALGGAILLVALLAPIVWFHEMSTGGFDGTGAGAPDRELTAMDAFGGWVLPAVLAATLSLLRVPLRRARRGLPWELFMAVVGVGLVILFVAVLSKASIDYPPCCDMVYWQPQARLGFLIGGVGGTLLLFGTLACWPRRLPWQPRHLADPGRST
jgi:hypothetical protein